MAALLALFFALVLIAAYVKLAARMLRKTLRWMHAFMYAAILGLLVIARSLTGLSFASVLPPFWAGLVGLAIGVAIGTWFFARRGANADGSALGTTGALRVTALALAISMAVGALLFLGIMLALH